LELDALDEQLRTGTGKRLLESATELRSRCLSTLSGVRRQREPGALPTPPASERSPIPPTDVLLSELSDAGSEPSRDDRGISVVLRDAFSTEGGLSEAGSRAIERLARVAKAHPLFPLLVVGHAGAPRRGADVDRRLAAVASRLSELGIARVESHNAGLHQPLLPRGAPSARERNERVELVFVAPGL
jgi:hypothetical protein